MKTKYVIFLNTLAISGAMFFIGCEKHLDDIVILEKSSTADISATKATTEQVDCLFQRWYDEGGNSLDIKEDDPPGGIIDDLLGFVFGQIKNAAFKKAGSFAVDGVIGLFVSKDVQPTLKELLDKLNDIQKSIEILNEAVKLSNYDAALREKETMYINLQSITIDTWHSLDNIDKDVKLSAEERVLRRKEAVKEWGDSNINGAGKGNYASINFAKKLMSITADQRSYYQVYDLYASLYFAFERQGWAWRENCRDRDMALLVVAFSLSNMYEVLHDNDDTASSLKETIEHFISYTKENKVDYSSKQKDENICNVSVLKGKVFMNNINKTPTYWSSGEDDILRPAKRENGNAYAYWVPYRKDRRFSVINCIKNYDYCMFPSIYLNLMRPTIEEITAIKEFFDLRSFKYKTLKDIFLSCGFTFDKGLFSEHAILVSGDDVWGKYESFWNNNMELGLCGVKLNDPGFENGRYRIGIAWLESKENQIFKSWDTKPDPKKELFNMYYR